MRANQTPSETSPQKRTIIIRFLLSLLPLVVFVWLLRKIELPLLPSAVARAKVSSLGLWVYGVWFLLAVLLRGIRWRCLVKPFAPISWRTSLDLTSIGNAAIVLLPMRGGEFVRPLLSRRYGLSTLAVASTIGAERIIDGLCVGLIVSTSLSLAPGHPSGFEILPPQFRDPHLVTQAARFALVLFSSGLAFLLTFYFRERLVAKLIERTLGRFAPGFAEKLIALLAKAASGLSVLKDGKSAATYLALTASYWAMQLVSVHLLLWACGFHDMRFIESCAVLGVFALGFMLPSPPGFFGAFQATFYAGLLLYYPVKLVTVEGSSVVFFAYVIQLSLTLAVGFVCYLHHLAVLARRQSQ